MPPPTILAHKTDFLTSQTLQLSRALAPSNTWRASNNSNHAHHNPAAATPPPLPEKAIDDALYRLNHALQQHARRVYAPQATRHVAEQIEALYLEAGERGVRAGDSESDSEEEGGDESGLGIERGGREARRLRVGVDFTSDDAIASLPPTWDQHPHPNAHHQASAAAQAEAHPPEARRYADLAAQLTALSARRKEARERVARLRGVNALLAPFRAPDRENGENEGGEEGGENGGGRVSSVVQPNLVTRNGEIERELERMRVLLVRVAGRVARLPPPPSMQSQSQSQSQSDGRKKKRKGRSGEEEDAVDDQMMMMGDQDLDVLEKRKFKKLLDGF
ncbi:hypothetical protein SLS62_009966 [Diatrype stigma]|uniref:Kinetochore protein fta4 n=1 Tax=Diatrype stigma TaxID=117547 RepID=A0AAN9UC99_9PEZI